MSIRLIILTGLFFCAPAFSSTTPAPCKSPGPQFTLREHMVCMSYGWDNAFAEIAKNNSNNAAQAAIHLDDVRRHMQMALGKEPSKLKSLRPEEARLKVLEFQGHLAEVLATVAQLEHRLLSRPIVEGNIPDDMKTNQLVMKLQQQIGQGHQRFR